MSVIQFTQAAPDQLAAVDYRDLLISLAIALALGQVLAWHYVRFAHVLSNKRKFSRLFVFVTATTFLMITVVKQSLALSLGLVGALSIIRFRTPIKEAEELAYLFLSIAIGVGLGAGGPLTLPTVVVVGVILLYLAVRGGHSAPPPVRTVLEVTAPVRGGTDAASATALRALLPAVEGACSKVDLRRIDSHDGELHASLLVEISNPESVSELLTRVQTTLPGATVSVIDHAGLE